ncbi:GyrI-like domain-containing protein [Gryllotalpicola ginsengisoli]|uniref:GyrI-like domain-containing protein n=1 Tax=Gryllotalpicola ginsengisoli TaxID=444608 RepID=UPI0003B59833|nr:GyrI-like domain-containing protein [Gryllotalpicola ginsengisoli]
MDVEVTAIAPRRVYAMSSGPSPIPADRVAAVVGPLFDRLADRLTAEGIEPPLPAVAWYEGMLGEHGEQCRRIWVGFTAPSVTAADAGVSPVILDGAAQAAVAVHHGDPAAIRDSWTALYRWVEEHGGTPSGYAREVYLKVMPHPRSQWVTELQLPFTGASGRR